MHLYIMPIHINKNGVEIVKNLSLTSDQKDQLLSSAQNLKKQ